ncbi:hypothetical protein EXIGLDRAFT_824424 [Exidia glandulosa HHB12029]|uniref:SET domain-containing protein n=1 Tax=Exidia glandulosa HHB12029 TaxID=1314781 RepID=A0A165J1G9_EXIGL|nr:hypothetical protein EXIGLDRAFT_824424 [Exidia glandulosa HHB12029]
MSSSKQSGTGAHDRMSSFDIAALEMAFMEMLSSLEGSSTPSPPATTTKGHKSTTDSKPQMTDKLELGLIRASDIAFPSGTDVYDYSPTAPFELDEKELKGFAPPSVVQTKEGLSIPPGAEPLGDPTCIMSFGVDNGSSAAVFCDPRTRQLLRAHPLHMKPLYVEPHHSVIPVYVAPSPQYGNGLGLFAARRIPAGERIFREPPLLVMSQQLNSAIGMEFDDLVEKALPPRTRAAFDSLTNCWPTGPGGHGARLGRHVVPKGSLGTYRQIEAGEEISSSYVDVTASKAARREEILRKYRFTCTCVRCGPA